MKSIYGKRKNSAKWHLPTRSISLSIHYTKRSIEQNDTKKMGIYNNISF